MMSHFHAYRASRREPSGLSDAAIALGLPVFPCAADKRPLTTHGFKDATKDPEKIRNLFSAPAATLIGVPTGEVSGFIVIDIDQKEQRQGRDWLNANQHRMVQTRTIRTASDGLHIYFRWPGQRVRNSNDKIAPGVDVRGDGGYVIVSPSPGYHIADNAPIAEIPKWLSVVLCPVEPDIPVIPVRLPGANIGNYGHAALESECTAIRTAYFGAQESTLNAAALKIGGLVAGGEIDYSTALAELVAAGCAMANEPGKRRWTERDVRQKVTRALRDGAASPRAPERPIPEAHPAAEMLARLSVVLPARPVPIEFFDVTGALKEFVDYSEKTAISPQPFLSLAAGISLIGALAGRKYRTTTDLRTNIYTVGIADSGGGKDHARKQIRRVIHAAGLSSYLGGSDIASSSGMRSALVQHPVRLFLIDEFGNWLSSILGERVPAHRAQIAALLKELYSSAGTILGGIEYADHSMRPREDIHQPHACVYGTSTPGQLWSAIGDANLHDGLMARMMLFVSPQSYPDEREPALEDPPASLIEALKSVAAGAAPGNLSAVMAAGVSAEPYTVPETPDAVESRRALRREQLGKQRAAEGTWITSIEGRFAENAMKLALVRAVSRCPENPMIETGDIAWGRGLARHCVETLLGEATQHVASTAYERRTQKILAAIRKAGPLTESELVRRHGIADNPRERAEALRDLVQRGQLVVISPDRSKPGPKSDRYMIAPAIEEC